MPTQREAGLRALKQGDFERALVLFESACWQHPEDFKAHYLLGGVYYQCRRYEQAVSALQRAIFLRPYVPEAHYNLGIALERLGKWEEAANEVRRALQLKPNYEVASGTLRKWARAGKITLTPEEETTLLAGLPRNWLTQMPPTVENDSTAPNEEAPLPTASTLSEIPHPSAEVSSPDSFLETKSLSDFPSLKNEEVETAAPEVSKPVEPQILAQETSLPPSTVPDFNPEVADSTSSASQPETLEHAPLFLEEEAVEALSSTLAAPPLIEWTQPEEAVLPLEVPQTDEVANLEGQDVAKTSALPIPPPIIPDELRVQYEVSHPTPAPELAQNASLTEQPSPIAQHNEPLQSPQGEDLPNTPDTLSEPVDICDLLAPPEALELPAHEELRPETVEEPALAYGQTPPSQISTLEPTDNLSEAVPHKPTSALPLEERNLSSPPPSESPSPTSHVETESIADSLQISVEPQSRTEAPVLEQTPLDTSLAQAKSEGEQADIPLPHTASSPENNTEATATSATSPSSASPASSKQKSATSSPLTQEELEPHNYFVPIMCPEAIEALQIGVASLVLFVVGIVLGPMAIRKGLEAKRWIAASPYFMGARQANIAIALGILSTVLGIVFCFHFIPLLLHSR